MNAESYDLLVRLSGAALGGTVLFAVGLVLAFLLWGRSRRKARESLARPEPPGPGASGDG